MTARVRAEAFCDLSGLGSDVMWLLEKAIEAAILEERKRIAAQISNCLAPPEGEAIAEMIRGSGGVMCKRFDPAREERERLLTRFEVLIGEGCYHDETYKIVEQVRKEGQS